ncbi:hypothetical protein [Rubritalea marina]|uniref:hypothetical protein n=1 Tax=Rubritalea marina TaxID=361055 RepID=UPI000360002C|nr:hypothetical protein [Rubritalea marina]
MKARDVIIDIRHEIRQARTDGSKETSLDKLEHLLDILDSEINEDEHKKDAHQIKMEHWRHVTSTSFEEHSKYTNLITVIGYGAFLAVWTSLREVIPQPLAMWSVFLIIASALVYLFDEIFSQMKKANALKSDANLYLGDVDEFLKRKEEVEETKEEHNISRISTWHFVFYWTTLTGLLSALLLCLGIIITALN